MRSKPSIGRTAIGVSGFAASTVLSAAASFASLPLVISSAGPEAWANVAVGQAIGASFSVLVSCGWNINGAATIALTPLDVRAAAYFVSAAARLAVLPLVLTASAVAGGLLVSADSSVAAWSAVASTTAGLTGVWYYVGVREPVRMLLFDSAPRALGTLVGASVVFLGGNLVLFPIGMLAGSIFAFILTSLDVRRRTPQKLGVLFEGIKPRKILGILRVQFRSIGTSAVASTYIAAPLVLMSQLAPSLTPEYAILDRLYRLTVMGLTPVLQAVQGWLPAYGVSPVETRARLSLALRTVAGLGLLAGATLVVFGPLVAELLAGASFVFGIFLFVPLGVAVIATSVSQISGPVGLVSVGRERAILFSAGAGAGVGCVLLILGVPLLGLLAACCAVAVSETVVTCYQLAVLLRLKEGFGRSSEGAGAG